MKFVLAPDSFKESMTATEVCQAMEKGIKKVLPTAEIVKIPMADGGEGTTASLVDATHGQYIEKIVTGPLHSPVTAKYGLLTNKTAIIEMAQASGLGYLSEQDKTPKNIKKATTYGTGELIIDALDHGAQKIIVGLGGSATNDGGSGMAQALGVHFFDKDDQLITEKLGGGYLNKISKIDISHIDPRINNIPIILASDVTNPLIGKQGATMVFGKQKGADQATQNLLEDNLRHYSSLIEKQLHKQIATISGSGAAGGLGGGLLAFTNSELQPGVQIIAQEVHLADAIQNADYVFTGEGGTDFQTQFGKTPFGVAQIAQKYHVPVISLAGYLGEGIDQLYKYGFTAIFGILDKAENLNQALKDGPQNIERTSENIVRLLLTTKK